MIFDSLYDVTIFFSKEDKGFIAKPSGFDTISAFGKTRKEALKELEKIMPDVLKIVAEE